jgi:drug/metabolite transporter (DMT)-like permease
VLIFGLTIWIWPKPDESSSGHVSPTVAAALGILCGTASGVAIAIPTIYGPALVIPEYSMIWFWFSWAIALVVGSLGAIIIGRFVHRAVRSHGSQAGSVRR